MYKFKFISLNVRGLRDTKKRAKIFHWLHQKNIDIAFLQETHSTKSSERIWRSQWGGPVCSSHGTTHSCGITILLSKSLPIDIINIFRDNNGRTISIRCRIANEETMLLNLYAPNSDTPQFFSDAFNVLKYAPNANFYIAGDFNTILSEQDIRGGKDNSHKLSTDCINNLVNRYQLCDVWRIRNPKKFEYTWSRRNPPIYERIDFWLISSKIQLNVQKTMHIPAFMSDHAGALLEIQDIEYKPGPGFWKLNTSYLNDVDYQNLVKSIITEANKEYQDAILKWEMIKLRVRGEAIKFTAQKAKSRRNTLEALEKKLSYYTDFDTPDFLSDDNQSQIELIQKDISSIMNYKVQVSMLRNKCRWHEGGEKITKYFFNLEKSQAKNKIIKQIVDKDGDTLHNQIEIMEEIQEYYKNLFSVKHTPIDQNYLSDIVIPQVPNAEQIHLNAPLSKEEMYIAIRQLNKNKCLGEDGFPIEWYQTFWPQIGTILHAVYVQNTTNGHMHGTGAHSLISLMPKPEKDLLSIKNWRPLSLLNCDYKIYAKAIANRLQIVLPDLIKTKQAL